MGRTRRRQSQLRLRSAVCRRQRVAVPVKQRRSQFAVEGHTTDLRLRAQQRSQVIGACTALVYGGIQAAATTGAVQHIPQRYACVAQYL